jgi:hypothetical protein
MKTSLETAKIVIGEEDQDFIIDNETNLGNQLK